MVKVRFALAPLQRISSYWPLIFVLVFTPRSLIPFEKPVGPFLLFWAIIAPFLLLEDSPVHPNSFLHGRPVDERQLIFTRVGSILALPVIFLFLWSLLQVAVIGLPLDSALREYILDIVPLTAGVFVISLLALVAESKLQYTILLSSTTLTVFASHSILVEVAYIIHAKAPALHQSSLYLFPAVKRADFAIFGFWAGVTTMAIAITPALLRRILLHRTVNGKIAFLSLLPVAFGLGVAILFPRFIDATSFQAASIASSVLVQEGTACQREEPFGLGTDLVIRSYLKLTMPHALVEDTILVPNGLPGGEIISASKGRRVFGNTGVGAPPCVSSDTLVNWVRIGFPSFDTIRWNTQDSTYSCGDSVLSVALPGDIPPGEPFSGNIDVTYLVFQPKIEYEVPVPSRDRRKEGWKLWVEQASDDTVWVQEDYRPPLSSLFPSSHELLFAYSRTARLRSVYFLIDHESREGWILGARASQDGEGKIFKGWLNVPAKLLDRASPNMQLMKVSLTLVQDGTTTTKIHSDRVRWGEGT
jgi:hypothetical protein